uniref:NADH-ubiquinone oxidoreductase chain 6 n=1 Tax=Gerres filamentosus TaxID=274467 RepID=A0A343WSN9_9TELE|nr:NADH dehydrogenase subunit 6 [Gerres filamentosus]
MSFLTFVFLMGALFGVIAVAANPSPFYAALGLVMASGMSCGILALYGMTFLSLILFLIYLGGMLVVFAYSAALAAEAYPETWGSRPVFLYALGYSVVLGLAAGYYSGGWYDVTWMTLEENADFHAVRGDQVGVGMLYGPGGWMLVLAAWVLLLSLIVVLELTRGLSRGALRAV